jgi:hypothetical protein
MIDKKYIDMFHKKYQVDKSTGCWNWIKPLDRDGYGLGTQIAPYTSMKPHRASLLIKGIDPAGMCVCHHCDNPKCVNPNHLFLGTPQDNHDDRIRKKRFLTNAGLPGEKNPRAKLSDKQVLEIRDLYKTRQVSQRQLAKEFGVSFTTMWQLLSNQTWKHL